MLLVWTGPSIICRIVIIKKHWLFPINKCFVSCPLNSFTKLLEDFRDVLPQGGVRKKCKEQAFAGLPAENEPVRKAECRGRKAERRGRKGNLLSPGRGRTMDGTGSYFLGWQYWLLSRTSLVLLSGPFHFQINFLSQKILTLFFPPFFWPTAFYHFWWHHSLDSTRTAVKAISWEVTRGVRSTSFWVVLVLLSLNWHHHPWS